MTLKDIAIRNLIRRKAKALFVLAGLVTGVATVVAVIGFGESVTTDITDKLEKYGANILITPKSENLALSYGGVSLGGISFDTAEIQEDALVRIQNIKYARSIAAVGPVLLGVVNVNGHRAMLAGVDVQASRILKPWWRVQGSLPQTDTIMLGVESARILGLKTGDPIRIGTHELRVGGVLQPTGSQDDQLLFTRLRTAQTLLNKPGQLSMIEVAALCTACPVNEMVAEISGVLPEAKVMAIQQVVKGRMHTLSQFKNFSYGISAVVTLVGSLVVLVTMMGSVRERTEEIGIFRAIGFRRRHVMTIVFLEAGMVSALAGICGFLVGLGGCKLALHLLGIGAGAALPLSFELAMGAISLAMVIGLAASAYPALLAARLDPNDALRQL